MALIPIRIGLIAGGVLAVAAVGSAVLVLRPANLAVIASNTSAPAVSVPAKATAAPSFDVVRVAPSGSAVLAGRSEPMAIVSVQGNGQALGEVHADARGEWVFLPPGPLAPGPQQLTLVARDGAGREMHSAANVVLLVPDRPAPASTQALAVAPPPDAMPEPALAVLAPEAGPMRILQAPAAPPGRLTLNVVDYDSSGQIRFAGAGPADTPVRIYVDNVAVGDARADRDGHWTLAPGSAVKPGVHDLRVDQIGTRGEVVSRVELPFQRADLPSLEAGRVVVQPGQNLWRIARAAYGSGVRYTIIYRANQDQIRNPDRIYPGQAFDVPVSN